MCNFDTIIFLTGTDEYQVDLLERGDVDLITVTHANSWRYDLEFDEIERGLIQKQKIYSHNPQGLQGWAFNTREWPFNDKRIREAFTLLIDRERILSEVFYGQYSVMDSYFPNSEYSHPDNPRYRFNPERAVQLLEDAGFDRVNKHGIRIDANGRKLIIELLTTGSMHWMDLLREDMLKYGIALEIRNMDFAERIVMTDERNFQVAYVAYSGLLYPNPTGMFHSSMADLHYTGNITGFRNPQADSLIEQELVTFKHRDRVAIIRQLDSIFMAEMNYALGWYAPYERLAYWNKFGHPDFYLPHGNDWSSVLWLWWVDPQKEARLNEAVANGKSSLPTEPTEIKFWDEYKSQQNP